MSADIGDIVRSAREAKCLSQSALAEMIGVSKQTIIHVEKNRRKPTYDVFCRLVHALDVSADLFVRSGSPTLTVEQDQFIQELLGCTKHEQEVVFATFRSFIRALRHDEPEKQV